jgi:hypothetical protein
MADWRNQMGLKQKTQNRENTDNHSGADGGKDGGKEDEDDENTQDEATVVVDEQTVVGGEIRYHMVLSVLIGVGGDKIREIRYLILIFL